MEVKVENEYQGDNIVENQKQLIAEMEKKKKEEYEDERTGFQSY